MELECEKEVERWGERECENRGKKGEIYERDNEDKEKRGGEGRESCHLRALHLNNDYYVLQFLGCFCFCPSLVPHSIH